MGAGWTPSGFLVQPGRVESNLDHVGGRYAVEAIDIPGAERETGLDEVDKFDEKRKRRHIEDQEAAVWNFSAGSGACAGSGRLQEEGSAATTTPDATADSSNTPATCAGAANCR